MLLFLPTTVVAQAPTAEPTAVPTVGVPHYHQHPLIHGPTSTPTPAR